MFTATPALCLERGGVPHIEADMANDILFDVLSKQQQQQTKSTSSLSFYYAQSYFDAISLCTPCKVSKRDALTEMGLRSYTDSPSFQTKMIKKQNNINNEMKNTKDVSSSSSSFSINFNHILLPRSPLYPVAGGLPTAEAGPSQDLIQGRVMMTTSKWNEVVSTTKPDIVSPLCELIAIQEASQLPARKKQSLTMRNEKWMKETIENISSEHQVQFLFPLGTHFINEKANNNNSNRSNSNVDNNNEDAAAPSSTTSEQQKPEQEQEEKFDSLGNKLNTGVTINEALYEQWCRRCAVMNSSSKNSNNNNNSFRLLGLLTLSSGETKEQLQQYLTDLFNALVPLEQKMQQKAQEQSEDRENDYLRGKPLPPLKLVVGNVSDLSLLEEVSKVFFSKTTNGGLMNFDTEIICLSSIAPVHLAANGLALQRTNATTTGTTSSSLMLNSSSPSTTATVRRERHAADDDQENTTSTTKRQDPHQQKLHQGQEAATQFSSSSVAKFHVINLWDPTFKFSTLPLSCAFASENKEELMKMNRDEDCTRRSASYFSCDCYTCQRHTAGYFHHLLDVHEMNAEILISVHNYTQWFKYLMTIA